MIRISLVILREGESVWVSLKATPRRQQYLNTLLRSRKSEALKAKTKKYGIKNADGRKEIKKFRVEINETETKKREKIKEIKSWFLEKISKINKF